MRHKRFFVRFKAPSSWKLKGMQRKAEEIGLFWGPIISLPETKEGRAFATRMRMKEVK